MGLAGMIICGRYEGIKYTFLAKDEEIYNFLASTHMYRNPNY